MIAGAAEADPFYRRNQPDPGGGDPHQRDGNQESVLAAQLVTKIAKQDRAQRTKAKANRKAGPRSPVRRTSALSERYARLADASP